MSLDLDDHPSPYQMVPPPTTFIRWQTETGTHMITPFPGSWCKLKPGSASLPFFGVQPVLLTPEGNEIMGPGEGILAIKVHEGGDKRSVLGSPQITIGRIQCILIIEHQSIR